MKFKMIQKTILASAFLSCSVVALASNQHILCPSANLIKKSASELNTVSFMGGKYVVWNLDYSFDDANLHWQVMSYTTASDFNTAFENGKTNAKSVSGQIDKYPMDRKDFYICGYSGGQDVVIAISFKDENTKFKLSSFDLNSLDLNSH